MVPSNTLKILIKPVFLIALFAVCSLPAVAQRRLPSPVDASNESDAQQLTEIEEEMRAKRQIEAADKAHKENVERARDLVSLSEDLLAAYKTNKQLGRDDLKKLERAQKLVKKIRNEAGG
ncbi:MAG TPA: hypothetical protein VIT88_05730, partial [Pyrinomonadaceae bacterium]